MFFWDALDLFSKTGVDENQESLFPAFPGPIQPIRQDPDFVPVYTSSQIKLYGIPDNWVFFKRKKLTFFVGNYLLPCY